MGLPCDWQIGKQNLSQRGQHLLETGQWSDCSFIVGQEPHQQTLKSHKLFLAMSSPVFEAMFFGGMAEKNDPIPIRDVQPEAFKAFLQYIYTDHVEMSSFELACELCYCAKKYMLPCLVEECTKYLWSDLSPKKACRAYEFAKLFEEPVLLEKCLQIICTNTNEVLKESSWEDVDLATLLTVLEQDSLQINSEIELFTAVERWAKAECTRKSLDPTNEKSLKSVIGNALSKIRLLSLTPQEFAEGPGRSPLITQDEAFNMLMNLLCTGNNTPMPEGFCTNTTARGKPVKIPTTSTTSEIGAERRRSFHSQFYSNSTIRYPLACLSWSKSSVHHVCSAGNTTSSQMDRDINKDEVTIVNNLPIFGKEGLIREEPKFYCLRPITQQTDCLNVNILDCSVTFSVDKNICVTGIQVPTQIALELNYDFGPSLDNVSDTYNEVLYAHLLDCDGNRLTYTHFTIKASFNTLVEVAFNRPVYIQKHKVYRVGVVFHKAGRYPIGVCCQNMACSSVFFSFGVGNSTHTVRDGLIRSIIFTYH